MKKPPMIAGLLGIALAASGCGSAATSTPTPAASSPPAVSPSPSLSPTSATYETFYDFMCPYFADIPDPHVISPVTDAAQVAPVADALDAAAASFSEVEAPADKADWQQSIDLWSGTIATTSMQFTIWYEAALDEDPATSDYAQSALGAWDQLVEGCP